MSASVVTVNEHEDAMKKLGFWIYLMTDCILFAALFATFIILRGTSGMSLSSQIFDMPYVLIETLVLLTSSFACGMTVLGARHKSQKLTLIGLGVTYILGVVFLTLELNEFIRFASEGHGWWASGLLSAFFTLVGTHGIHIAVGLLWSIVVAWQVISRGFTRGVMRRLTLFSLFWHFLDVIWIFIFTIVYLMGVA